MLIRLVLGCVLVLAAQVTAWCADVEGDSWFGREFMPRRQCTPKVGKRSITWDNVPLPLKVQKVEGDWLWVGEAWVRKQDVVPIPPPIEEFAIARNGEWPIVPVTIDGRDYEFIVDTGCTNTVVDKSLEHTLHQLPGTSHINGLTDQINNYHLPAAFVGRSKLPVTGQVNCIDLEPFRTWSGRDIRGMLGMTFLKGKIVTIDFGEGKLTIRSSLPVPPANTFRLSYNQTRRPTLDFEIAPKQTLSFMLDTGSMGHASGEIEPSSFAELTRNGHLILTGQAGKDVSIFGEATIRYAKLKQFRLGRFEHANLEFTSGRSNTLGLGYLSRFVATFDFQNDYLHLQKGSRFNMRPRADLFFGGILLRVGGDTFATEVFSKSPAAVAGLRNGDRIISIDGKCTLEFSLFELYDLFTNKGRNLRLVVQGDDEPRAIDVKLADWHVNQTAAKNTDRLSQ